MLAEQLGRVTSEMAEQTKDWEEQPDEDEAPASPARLPPVGNFALSPRKK